MQKPSFSAIINRVRAAGPIEILMVLCALTLIIVSHAVQIWTLDKSFISFDEGWYMYLQDNAVSNLIIRGQLLFRFIPILNDLFYNRVGAFIIATVGQFVLAYGFYKWVKSMNARCNFLVVWGLVCMFSLKSLGCTTLNYAFLVDPITSISIGFGLIGIANRKPLYFSMSGFFISLLIPLKITSLIFAPILLIVILSVSNKPWRDLMYSTSGFAIGFIIYLIVFDSPTTFYNVFLNSFNSAIEGEIDPNHSLKFMVSWTKETLLMYFKWILTAYIIFWMPKTIGFIPRLRNHSIIKVITLSSSVVIILLFFWFSVHPIFHPHNYKGFLINATWILATLTIFYTLKYNSKKSVYILLMLFATPFCTSIGTDVLFTVKSFPLFICIIPSLYQILPQPEQKSIKICLLILLILSICIIIYPPTKDRKYTNWNNDVYTNQKVTLMTSTLKHPIKVDNEFMHYFNFYKDNVPTGSHTLSAVRCWGVVYLLKLHSVDNEFRFTYDNENLKRCKKILNSNKPIYFLWVILDYDNLWTHTDIIEKYLDYFKKNGYNIIMKNQGDYHLAIVEPKNE